METFKGAEVAPIDEILERTHYVQAKNVEIECLRVVVERLFETIGERKKFADDVLSDNKCLAEENEQLRRQLAAAHQELHDLRIRAGLGEGGEQWQPVGNGYSYIGASLSDVWRELNFSMRDKFAVLTIYTDQDSTSIVLPDHFRLCRLVEGQPATGKGV